MLGSLVAVMAVDPDVIAAARAQLAQLGVTVADLQRAERPRVPTVAEYLPAVVAAANVGSRRAYGTYWQRMAAAWADRPLDTIAASDVAAMQRRVTATAQSRRNSRGGRHAGELVIAAARAFYNRAIADGLLDVAVSPAHRVVKPRRLPCTRRALTPDELAEINLVARTSGNDAILDALLLRLHTETACRRGGALGLRLADLDVERGLVRLREKAGVMRWQPITLDLATALAEHAQLRGAVLSTDALLRFRAGQALTSRRYDHLWNRIGHELPWVASHGISTHWLRHTTLTWGLTPFRVWHRPGVRRPHGHYRPSDSDVHQSGPSRRRGRPCCDDRPAAPHGGPDRRIRRPLPVK
jgi:integrase